MNDFTILHLSDLHINQKGKHLSLLMKNLLIDIKNEMKLVDNIIIVVTGDLVHRGNYEYKDGVIYFFEKLYECIGDKVKDIYIVPGNHDKVRNFIDEKILREYEYYSNSPEKFYKNYWKYFLVSFADYQELIRQIYSKFLKEDELKIREKIKEDTYGAFVTEINEKKICFLSFNTSWSCLGDLDERNLKFGKFQLDKIKEEYYKNAESGEYNLVIALAHHPLNWLTGEEETLVQTNILSNYSLNCNIYISGHIHNRDIISWQSTRHSLTTLVSGLGWPDEEEDMQHPYAHTYSSYTFNLDTNSIDVYVRSSDDNSTFEPDFRIYTNKRDKANNKIVMPIDSNKTQAYFNLGIVKGRSPKSYYITEDTLSLIQVYMPMVGKFRKYMYIALNQRKKDILDQIEAELSVNQRSAKKFKEKIVGMLDDSFFRGMPLQKEAKRYLCKHSEMVNASLISYMQNICSKLSELLEESLRESEDFSENEMNEKLPPYTVRVHFRGYDIKKDSYDQLCVGDSEWNSYKMRSQNWGELIEEAYKAEHSLVASANKNYCAKSYQINEEKDKKNYKWMDFMTYIPEFVGNKYIEYDKESGKIRKERPWITFGITVYARKSSNMLYILDFLKIGQIITECIQEFKGYMPVKIEKFVKEKLEQKWE